MVVNQQQGYRSQVHRKNKDSKSHAKGRTHGTLCELVPSWLLQFQLKPKGSMFLLHASLELRYIHIHIYWSPYLFFLDLLLLYISASHSPIPICCDPSCMHIQRESHDLFTSHQHMGVNTVSTRAPSTQGPLFQDNVSWETQNKENEKVMVVVKI